jgi:hypothetical protein
MDFGVGFREVVAIHFSQQHRAFDSLGLGQLRGFSFGEPKLRIRRDFSQVA